MNEVKIARLESILEMISNNVGFEKILDALKVEYKLEGGNSVKHEYQSFGFHLEETITKEAAAYKKCMIKNKYKGCIDEYNSFISVAEDTVLMELTKLR